jgi:hypothetical protein
MYSMKAIDLGEAAVQEAPCWGPGSPERDADDYAEAQLLHVSCELGGLENFTMLGGAILVPESVGVEQDVALFQWSQQVTSRTQKDSVGGGTTTVKKYSYSTGWHSEPVPSSSFKNPHGHTNPPSDAWPIRSSTQYAQAVRAGQFAIGDLVERIPLDTVVALPSDWPTVNPALASAPQPPLHLGPDSLIRVAAGEWLYSGDATRPVVGELKVRWKRSSATHVSVLGALSGDSFVPWDGQGVRDGYGLLTLYEGELTAREMFLRMAAEAAMLTWMLRLAALVCAWFGYMAISQPLALAPDLIPCVGPLIGDLVGCALAAVAFLVAVVYCAVIGAIAWLRFRPLIASVLLVVAAGAAFLVASLRKRAGKAKLAAVARTQEGTAGSGQLEGGGSLH